MLRLPIEKALIIVRGHKVLKVDKYDYSLHHEARKLSPRKASGHIPEWAREAATGDAEKTERSEKAMQSSIIAQPDTTNAAAENGHKRPDTADKSEGNEVVSKAIVKTDKASIMSKKSNNTENGGQ